MLKPVRVTPPATDKPLLTKDECKQFLRVDHADEDTLIESLRDAVTAYLDGYAGILGRALINQTWKINLCRWPGCDIRLPLSPVSAITSIKYWDTATPSVQQTVTASDYSLLEDALSPFVRFSPSFSAPALYDRDDVIEVLFVTGYGADNTAVPAAIKAAALLLIGHWYEVREAVNVGNITSEIPLSVKALLAPFRRVGV